MATSLSNETSTASLVELSQSNQHSSDQSIDCSYGSSSKSQIAAARYDSNGFSSGQGANAMTSSNQNQNYSVNKSRGDSIQTSQFYQQSQSSQMQGSNLQYPSIFYPNAFLQTYTQPTTSSYNNYQGSVVGAGNMSSTQSSSTTTNNRRGGKKKAPTTQSQNPEMRMFFNLRRRDSQIQTNKGQSHVYKLKNPPQITEWFKRLSVEERVNALSTVCPHLTETLIKMSQHLETKQYQFGKRSTHQSDKYNPIIKLQAPISYQYPSDVVSTKFEDNFYVREISDQEINHMGIIEKEIMLAEKVQSYITLKPFQEIIDCVRLTDYFQQLDTLTVTEELVQDADDFFKKMGKATNNQAFTSSCQFEFKNQNPTIEQPSWFKPTSFHNFAIWIIVALEENLWAHYNYDNNTNMGTAKANELVTLFREKTDMGAQDIELSQLSQYWMNASEEDKQNLTNSLKTAVLKEMEQEFNSGHGGTTKSHKVVNKNMQYSIQIKEKPEIQALQDQVDRVVEDMIDQSRRQGKEKEFLTNLIYTNIERIKERQVIINRKFLDLIKKKLKDDLMENLLLEEQQTTKSSKQFKKKKKKNFNNSQQSAQGLQSNTIADKTLQSSTENTTIENDTANEDQAKSKNKKKKGKTINNQETTFQPSINSSNPQRKKKKNNQARNTKESQQTQNQDTHSCDDQPQKIDDDSLEKEDTVESDNKNSSLDTKSSSNLFELTAHQSNNSTTNSTATFKSAINKDGLSFSHKNKESIPPSINSSKSQELNQGLNNNKNLVEQSKIKQQKLNTKIETKNYQILQISSNQERNKNDNQKRKNSTNKFNSNQIFSEDDANSAGIKNSLQETEGESDSMEIIKSYVLELTNQMINEVCRKLENESPNRTNEETQNHQKQQNQNNNTGQKSSKDEHKHQPNNKQNKKQKNDHGYYGGNQKPNNTTDGNRKKSFNSKKYVKEEKHFVEDHYEKNSQYQNLHNQSDLNESQSVEQPVLMSQLRKSSNNDHNSKQNPGQRKGFGTHLKPVDKVEDTRQTMRSEDNQAWAKGTVKQNETVNQKKKSFNMKDQEDRNEQDSSQCKINPEINETASQSTNKDDASSTHTLNRKKRNKKKVKLTDSDIMNNFMKNLHQVDESKPQPDHSQQYKKVGNRSETNKYKDRTLPKQQTDNTPVEVQQQIVKSDSISTQEDNKSQGKPYKGRYAQKNSLLENQSQSQIKPIVEEQDQSQQQNPQSNSQYYAKRSYQYKQHKPYTHQSKRNTLQNSSDLPIITDDKESANSTKAECLSDDKSNKSQNEKVNIGQDNELNGKCNAFRQLNFQTAQNDSQNVSFADFTETTNSNINSSIENTNYISKCQSYSSTPCKPTPYHPKNHNTKPNANNIQVSEQESANYRTPPQLSKKTSSSSSAYTHHGNFRKPHQNGQTFNTFQPNNESQYQSNGHPPKNSQRTQGQYRQTNRPQQSLAHNLPYQQQVQPMNISQSMQEQRFMPNFLTQDNNNIFYQDQNVFLPQSVDTQYKSQDGIFPYIEKNPMMMPQPINVFTPTQYQSTQYVPLQGSDLLPNPFNYQQNRMPSYFDQSQDLIYQIFNSIKSNHSMSPIPQMMSPPPIIDYQMSQVSDLSLQPQMSDALSINQQIEHQNSIAFHQLLDQEIEDYNRRIEENIALLKPERDYIINKLQQIANTVFPGEEPQIALFGSLTTGLALESSDMDLAVTGLKIDDRYIMVQDLHKLASALQDWEILESFKSIETASIPVIKMKVDLEKLRQIELKEQVPDDFQKRPMTIEQRYLSVDITFDDSSQPLTYQSQDFGNPSQTKTHLGLQSCALVQHYIATYKHLKPVAILLKKFLAIHELNSPYYVAYMNYYGMRGNYDLTPSRLLMGFLEFYGSYFSPNSMGISVFDEGLLDSNFVILDPLNLSNNTTKNSYHTKEILMKFQCAFNNLKSLMSKLPLLQQAALSSQSAAFSKANSQDQKSSIPYEIASLQPTQFLNNSSIQYTSINQCEQKSIIEEEEKGCDEVPQQHYLMESEACRLALSSLQDSLINQPLNVQVSLLETFFAKDAQPVTDLRGLSQSQSEPRGTQINMIEEAQTQ